MCVRTSIAFHFGLRSLIEHSDPQPDIHLHLLLLQLAGHSVLHDDVRRVLRELFVNTESPH